MAPLAAFVVIAINPGSLQTQEAAAAAEEAPAGPRPMTIVDLINVPGIGSPEISPDGSQLLYTRTDADWDENGTITHIWRVNADGSGSMQMTNGEKGESNPSWSPDGRTIAFVAERGDARDEGDDEESGQIYLLRNDGGEARALTEHPTGVSGIQWSPDGAWIYFTAADDKTEEEKARENVEDNVFRYDENQKNSHLWRVDVASGETERITEGDFSLRGYRLSRDGNLIVAHQAPTPLFDDFLNAELWVMRANGTEARQLTSNLVPESGAEISPDNSHVLFTANTSDALDGFYYNNRMFVIPISGGDAESLVPGGDYDINGATWSADGSAVYFRANTGLRQNLHAVALASGEITPVTEGDHSIWSWDYEPGLDLHAFSISSPTLGSDLWLLSVAAEGGSTGGSAGAVANDPRRITRVHEYVAEEFLLPRVEAVEWPGEDGVMVEGLLYYPLDYRPGTRYPVVVQTHGGPASSDKFSFFSSSRYEPVLASMGYFVFKPNYRGSTGYGDEFLRDMVGHYFNQAHRDVMAGVDYLIARGLVDGDRMAKMGWSAGGHMTNKIITYTDRFKAASSGAGAINWISMYGQSDVRIYRTPWFGGTPWDEDSPIEQFLADSPLFDVHKVTTPTIVLVGENDARVPMPQSVELYRALKHNGVPTHLYVAPEQGHGWRELQQRLFKANVELDWFEKWVMEREYEWEKSPVHPEEDEESEEELKKAA
jgi:dipeptidyl aminopeptidase/acylaminoacyl peptidase